MFQSKKELCTGIKIAYPKMKVYQRKLEKPKPGDSDKKYSFELVKEIKNLVRKKTTQEPKFGHG